MELPSCSFKTVSLTDLSLNDWAMVFKRVSPFQLFRKVFEPAPIQTLKWTPDPVAPVSAPMLLLCFCFFFKDHFLSFLSVKHFN